MRYFDLSTQIQIRKAQILQSKNITVNKRIIMPIA